MSFFLRFCGSDWVVVGKKSTRVSPKVLKVADPSLDPSSFSDLTFFHIARTETLLIDSFILGMETPTAENYRQYVDHITKCLLSHLHHAPLFKLLLSFSLFRLARTHTDKHTMFTLLCSPYCSNTSLWWWSSLHFDKSASLSRAAVCTSVELAADEEMNWETNNALSHTDKSTTPVFETNFKAQISLRIQILEENLHSKKICDSVLTLM